MKSVKQLVSRFVKGEEGVSLLEYGLLAALIAVVCVAVLALIGTELNAKFQTIEDNID